ncbi:MAG: Gfo/Idh/MocA family protein, partial [Planctomycetota bacterium]
MPSTRRKFLGSSCGVIAGSFSFANILPTSALGSRKPAPSNRITMGLIGTGGRGNWNLKGFLNNSDVEILAICDVDTNQREKTRQRLSLTPKSCYNDYRELLAHDDIDAVVISTPDHWHVPIAVAAAKAGKDIFCEKPMSLTIAEGRVLSDTVKRYGRILQVGSQQRSDSRFNLACELVQKGKLGKLKIIKVGLPGSRISGPQPIM